MKYLAENLSGLLIGKPAAAVGQENQTLDKVLQQWAPELLQHPEQIARIRKYTAQDLPDFPIEQEKKIRTDELEKHLRSDPPFLSEDKVRQLIVMLNGMIAAMEHFNLQSSHELTALVQASKAAFLLRLKQGGSGPEGDRDDEAAVKSSHKSRKKGKFL